MATSIDHDSTKVRCKVCLKTFSVHSDGKSDLDKHLTSLAHKKSMKSLNLMIDESFLRLGVEIKIKTNEHFNRIRTVSFYIFTKTTKEQVMKTMKY